MKTIELSIDGSYLDWGLTEGIRELVQNAIDADVKGTKMTIDYDATKETFTVANLGASLSRKTLLLGFTSKRGDIDQIGQYGEGMKLGCLGLLKAGCSITIWNQNEMWVPKLVHSKEFDQEVLAFEIHDDGIFSSFRKFDGVKFEVRGIPNDKWEASKKQFLIFEDTKKIVVLDTPYGKVLMGKDMFGKMYVNGILVEQIADEEFSFGYNFNTGHIKVDRDRKMVDRHNIKSMTAKCWVYLATQNDTNFEEFENLLKRNQADVQDLRYGWTVTAELKQRLAKSFKKHYGDNAVPVLSQDQVSVANHIGRLGLIYGQAYTSLIQEEIGTLDELQSKFSLLVQHEFDTMDLNPTESANLYQAWNVLAAVLHTDELPTIKVVTFNENNTLGLYVKEDGKQYILLNKIVLEDFPQTLRVMIHEVAHQKGNHESKGFQDYVEETWRDAFSMIVKRQIKFGQPVANG